MGCNSSRMTEFHAERVNDSIHAMMARELQKAQQSGQMVCGYKPAQPHPLLLLQKTIAPIIITCMEEEEEVVGVVDDHYNSNDGEDQMTFTCSISERSTD